MTTGPNLVSASIALFTAVGMGAVGIGGSAVAEPLAQLGSIPVASLTGPISDIDLDYAGRRLFLLARDSGAFAVIDLAGGTASRAVAGLPAPRGIAHEPPNGQIFIALGEGSLAVYQGEPPIRTALLHVGSDLGPPHYDAGTTRVYLAADRRSLAVLETSHDRLLPAIGLDGNPGALAFESDGSRLFAAATGEGRIMVADRVAGMQTGSLSTGDSGEAAALALDEDAGLLLVAFRQPAVLAWFDLVDGSAKGRTGACTEPGSLIADGGRGRVYLTCGEGRIEIYQRTPASGYQRIGKLDTAHGAVAALLAPLGDRLYLAVPATNERSAEVRIYEPEN